VANGRVLVLDGDKAQALDIVRCLGRDGLAVDVGASSDDAIAFKSRYTCEKFIYPRPDTCPEHFLAWLVDTVRNTAFDMVVPVTDLTMIPLAKEGPRFNGLAAIATESWDKLQTVRDKSKTMSLARSVGVPVPPTSAAVATIDELDRLLPALTFPVVSKAVVSTSWSNSGFRAPETVYALDRVELREQVSALLAIAPVIVQEHVAGNAVGVEVLTRGGEILQAFQHERLHELPLSGGGSTYRASVSLDPLLLDYARRLMAAIGWTGVAMIEFKVDHASHTATLLEINGRFWGSLPLASRAGMRFATDLYRLLVRGEMSPPRSYRTGVRCRKLREDLTWFIAAATLRHDDPLVRASIVERRTRFALLRDFWRLVALRDYHDIELLSDHRPGLTDLHRIARFIASGLRRKLVAGADWLSGCFADRGAGRRLRRRLAGARRLVFVCYGNIIRSPFASSYVSSRARGADVEVASAGLFDRAGRRSDPRAVAAARAWNVDLEPHRSRVLDRDLVDWADLILVMDRTILRRVQEQFPDATDKTYLFGLLDPTGDAEIADPFSKDATAVEWSCRRIVAAAEELLTSALR